MRSKSFVALAASALVGATVALAAEQGKARSEQTLENLDKAMHGEAFAYAKYMLYAREARESGHPETARLFEDAARMELGEHFAEQAELAGLVDTTEENLRDAIGGETYESEKMYRQFASQARAAGDRAAAERFDELARDENRHRAAFQEELDRLEQEKLRGG